MTSAIYLASVEPAGKTALAAVIGKKLIGEGKNVGYFMPLELSESGRNYEDASFIKEILNLDQDVTVISPEHRSAMGLWKILAEDSNGLLEDIKRDYEAVAEDKDIVLVEGLSGLIKDGNSTLACYRISEALNIPVLLVLRYSDTLDPAEFQKVQHELGGRMVGVIINFVPQKKCDFAQKEMVKKFRDAGLPVLGLIPEDRALAGISVKDLAKRLGAEIITAKENLDGIVENIMLASLPLEAAPVYFGRKHQKAVVIRGERHDTQLTALETPTACLILTGNAEPQSMVTNFAEEKKIPVMLVRKETDEVLADMEKAAGLSAFNNVNKLARFEELLKGWNFKSLFSATGQVL
jgi:uncharacterized protein